jgi:hypothetical protein
MLDLEVEMVLMLDLEVEMVLMLGMVEMVMKMPPPHQGGLGGEDGSDFPPAAAARRED